jgi:hypothetical protein
MSFFEAMNFGRIEMRENDGIWNYFLGFDKSSNLLYSW